jgi:hypothetical protein
MLQIHVYSMFLEPPSIRDAKFLVKSVRSACLP